MGKTSIEWCDHSINPFRARNIETGKVGHYCVKISAGCKNCYSARMQNPYLTQLDFIAENRHKVELFLAHEPIEELRRRMKPTRYFWCDMTDMFLADYPDAWIRRCFEVMRSTSWHTHMVLTKRPERMLALNTACDLLPDGDGVPTPNIWVGVSVEDHERKSRISTLLRIPAAVRFLSIEPLIGDVGELQLDGIHWVIVGGESGPRARPIHPDWVRSIRDQCQAAGIPFFMKQMGSVFGPHKREGYSRGSKRSSVSPG